MRVPRVFTSRRRFYGNCKAQVGPGFPSTLFTGQPHLGEQVGEHPFGGVALAVRPPSPPRRVRVMVRTAVATLPGDDGPHRPRSFEPIRREDGRTPPRRFFREVRDEMRQVAWPTRPEVLNYTSIVGTVLVLMIGLIFGLNYGASHGVTWMFQR